MPDKIKEAFTAINDKELFLDEQDFRDNVIKDPKGTFEALNNYGKTKGFFLDYGDFESALDLKKKVPSVPTFSTSLEEVIQPLPNGVKEIAQSPLTSNLKSEIPTYIDPTKPLKTKDVVDVNAEKKPFDSNVIREQRKQRMGTHSSNLMAAIVKEPDLYTKKASTSHYGTQFVPETPNIENISKAIDVYADKIKRTTGEDITTYDKQYLVNSVAEQVKQRKDIAEAASNASLRATNRKELPSYAYTGVTNNKGEVLTKGFFQEANEKIINEQNKEVNNYKINSQNLTNKVALEVAPEVNALKLDVKSKAEMLNQEVATAFNKSFEEKDKALYAQYNQLVQSGQMTPEVANGALKIKREELQKQTQDEVTAAYAPKFDQLNKDVNLKSKDIQSRYNRNYLAKANLLKEATDKRLQEIAQKNMVNMPKGYMEKWGKDFQESLSEINKKNINQAYLEAKNTPMAVRMSKAITAGFGDVLGSIGGAMSFAGLDASAVNDVVIKTAMQNELASGAYYQIKDEESKLKGNKYENFGEKLLDPSWWIDNGVRSVPFMLATMPVGIAAGYGTGTLVKMLGASKRAAAISSAVGGGAVSWLGEATLEAGSAFNDALKQGYSEKDAGEIAARTYENNLSTLPLSVFQMMPVFSKAFNFTKAFAMETVSGGAEEILQGWSQAQANASAQGQDVSIFEYAKTPQALEEGTIGAAMSSGMALFALDNTPNIDKQISALMSSISVGGEQHARAVLDIMNKNKAITDVQYKEANLQLDYIMNGIESVQNFNVDDNVKVGLVGKFAKIGRAKAMLTDDENDLASQAAKEMIAEQEKEIKEILKGTTPLYLVFEKGNPIPTAASKEDFIAILKDPKLREQFTLQAINDDKWQSQVDKVYKTETPTVSEETSPSEVTAITDINQEQTNAEQEITPTTQTTITPSSDISSKVQASGNVEQIDLDFEGKPNKFSDITLEDNNQFDFEYELKKSLGFEGNQSFSGYKGMGKIGDNGTEIVIRVKDHTANPDRIDAEMDEDYGDTKLFINVIPYEQKGFFDKYDREGLVNIYIKEGDTVSDIKQKVKDAIINYKQNDKENITGLQSNQREGQEPKQTKPNENRSAEEISASGNVQTYEEKVEPLLSKETPKAEVGDISKEDENYKQSREVTEAVSKENPEASVLIHPKGEDLSLTAVYVGKEKRGQGIGSKVLESVKRQADKLGKKVVLDATKELDEETDLERLGNFYEKNGFVKVGENKFEYNSKETLKEESKPITLPTEDKSKEIALQKESESEIIDKINAFPSSSNTFDQSLKESMLENPQRAKLAFELRDLASKVWEMDLDPTGKNISSLSMFFYGDANNATEFLEGQIKDANSSIERMKGQISRLGKSKSDQSLIKSYEEDIASREKAIKKYKQYLTPSPTTENLKGETTEKPTTKEVTPTESPVFDDKNMTKEGGEIPQQIIDKEGEKEYLAIVGDNGYKYAISIGEGVNQGLLGRKEDIKKAEAEYNDKGWYISSQLGIDNLMNVFVKNKEILNYIIDKKYHKELGIKTTVQETRTEAKTEQTKKVVKDLNTAEVEAVAKVLARENTKQGKTEAKNARKTEASKSIKETQNAETILAITNNLDMIRAKLLESGDIKTIDCKWG